MEKKETIVGAKYVVGQRVYKGMFSAVFRGYDNETFAPVAIKLVRWCKGRNKLGRSRNTCCTKRRYLRDCREELESPNSTGWEFKATSASSSPNSLDPVLSRYWMNASTSFLYIVLF